MNLANNFGSLVSLHTLGYFISCCISYRTCRDCCPLFTWNFGAHETSAILEDLSLIPICVLLAISQFILSFSRYFICLLFGFCFYLITFLAVVS